MVYLGPKPVDFVMDFELFRGGETGECLTLSWNIS